MALLAELGGTVSVALAKAQEDHRFRRNQRVDRYDDEPGALLRP